MPKERERQNRFRKLFQQSKEQLPPNLWTNLALNLNGLNLALFPLLRQSGPALELGLRSPSLPNTRAVYGRGACERLIRVLLEMREGTASCRADSGQCSHTALPSSGWGVGGRGAQVPFLGLLLRFSNCYFKLLNQIQPGSSAERSYYFTSNPKA